VEISRDTIYKFRRKVKDKNGQDKEIYQFMTDKEFKDK
jgi:hypothetical protein